jgi:hypothetical protein
MTRPSQTGTGYKRCFSSTVPIALESELLGDGSIVRFELCVTDKLAETNTRAYGAFEFRSTRRKLTILHPVIYANQHRM